MGIGVLRYLTSLNEQFGVHPLDINKTTISGYGSYLFQQNLMIHKRVGQFSPNVLPIYACLKSAATGGLTMVTRHSANGKDKKDEAPINSHLFPDNQERGVGTGVFDIASLYPSSMLHGLPYGPGYYCMRAKTNPSIKARIFTKCYDKYGREMMNSAESQVVQYLTQVKFSNAKRVYSSFHAGTSQMVFGRSLKKRVDLTILEDFGKIQIIQYHDRSHYLMGSTHDKKCHYFKKNETYPLYNMETVISDDENSRYAKYLSENVPGLEITYKVYNECDFFHSNSYEYNGSSMYDSPKDYLEKNVCESVFKPVWLDKNFNEKFLLDKILNTKECDGSFVVVRKDAHEDKDDLISKQFAFCLQRNSPDLDELGPQTYEMAKDMVTQNILKKENESNEEFEQKLKKATDSLLLNRLKHPISYTRKSFKIDQCLPVKYFKWLVKNRNLSGVEILHYVHYELRDYAYDFIYSLLQMRHEINQKFKETGEKDTLSSYNLKLLANAMYGFTMVEISNYFKFTYALEDSIRRYPKVDQTKINLLSIVKDQKSGKQSFLYQLKYQLSDHMISNTLQVGATILGNSRVIFYDHIYKLLTFLDPRKAELCYLDTDSVFFFIAHEDLNKCLKHDQINNFKTQYDKIFVDPNSPYSQASKLKMEGYYQTAFFKCVKNYILVPFAENDQSVVKSKGNPKLIRDQMTPDNFCLIKKQIGKEDDQNDEENLRKKKKRKFNEDMFYQHRSLHPTMGEQIFISKKRRKMANGLNFKRILTSVSTNKKLENYQFHSYRIFFFFSELLSYISHGVSVIHHGCNKPD